MGAASWAGAPRGAGPGRGPRARAGGWPRRGRPSPPLPEHGGAAERVRASVRGPRGRRRGAAAGAAGAGAGARPVCRAFPAPAADADAGGLAGAGSVGGTPGPGRDGGEREGEIAALGASGEGRAAAPQCCLKCQCNLSVPHWAIVGCARRCASARSNDVRSPGVHARLLELAVRSNVG